MESWQIGLLAVIGAAAVGARFLCSAWQRYKGRKQRDFTRKLETVLQKKETVEVVCPQRGGRVILTSTRLLLETKEGFTALPLSRIKSLRGTTAEDKSTVVPARMKSLTIKADTDLVLQNTGEEFLQLAKRLKQRKK